MKITKTLYSIFFAFFLAVGFSAAPCKNSTIGQVRPADQKEQLLKNVRYTVLSQQWLPEEERTQFIVLKVRFRFSNEGKDPIMYLARNIGTIYPTGPQVYRKAGEKEWQSWEWRHGKEKEPPALDFRGNSVTWLVLYPGDAIEFDASDSSKPDEEHAYIAYIKPFPDGRLIEIYSDIYRPLSK